MPRTTHSTTPLQRRAFLVSLSVIFGSLLGIGSSVVVPVIAQAATQYTSIAAGGLLSCGIRNGAAQCWGTLPGDGSASSAAPVAVTGLTSGVTAISVGGAHACAIRLGGVWCWGKNDSGQLGDGTGTTRSKPVYVTIPNNSVAMLGVTAGAYHTCAFSISGQTFCWGFNGTGQLGNNSVGDSSVPVATSIPADVESISAGGYHTCAIRFGGSAWCWGWNSNAMIGDGTFSTRLVPTAVTGLTSGVTAISAGFFHSCAVVGGGAKCWGSNVDGQVGSGSSNPTYLTAVGVSGLSSGVTAISAGFGHSCAIVGGAAKCWGRSLEGQLGYGPSPATNVSAPVVVLGLTSGVTSISAGFTHSCAIQTGSPSASWCWGKSNGLVLGDGSSSSTVPVLVAEPLDGQVVYDHVSTSDTAATIYWTDNVTNEKGYLVYRVEGSSQTLVNCPTTQPNLTSCTDTGLTPGTYYQYYVYAYNVLETRYPGTYMLARTLSPYLSIPEVHYAFAAGPNTVKVGWLDYSLSEDGYRVYRYTPSGYVLEATTGPDATSATFTDLAMNTTVGHTFVVKAFRGTTERAGDSYIFSLPRTGPSGPLPAPTYEGVTAYGTTGSVISWKDNASNENGYLVYRVSGSNSTLLPASLCPTSVPNNQICSDFDSLTPGQFYQYYVYGWNNSGVSYAGTPVVFHAPNPLNRPFIQSTAPLSRNSIRVSWLDDSDDETGFAVLRYDSATGTYATVATVGANVTSADIGGLSPATTYVFIVVANRTAASALLQPATSYAEFGIWATTPV